MNWKFCIDTPEQKTLDFCGGSINVGDAPGVGYGFSNGDGNGVYILSYSKHGAGYGSPNGDGTGFGYNWSSPKEWQ